jgi:GDP-4-dehydro-6-deoxy-D-mannose reductase
MESLRGTRVLVTGVSGFVGRHLARVLAERGAAVHGTGADPGTPRIDGVHAYAAGFDVRDAAVVLDRVAAWRPDAIVHLAGQASAGRSFDDPVGTFRVNAAGTWNLLESVRRAAPRARALVVGSADVYGSQPEGSRVGEDAPLRPVSPYGLSKAAADLLAQMAAEDGLDVVRSRSFAHAGPGQDPRFAVPSWARQIAAIEAGAAEAVIRVGNLEVTRDLCDVRDVARAYVDLLERGVTGRAYNVCRGEGLRMADVLGALVAMARARVRIEVDPSLHRPADLPYLVGDPTAIGRDVGWSARIALDETLRAVLEDARARGTVERVDPAPPRT